MYMQKSACLASPCLLNRHGHQNKSAVLLNKYRKQETLEKEIEVLDGKAFNYDPSGFNQLHASCTFSIADHARIWRGRSLLCPKKLHVNGFNNKAVSTI